MSSPVAPAAARGLSGADAARRLEASGPNTLRAEKTTPVWRLLWGQFNSPVIWLLFAACAISGAIGELADALAIGSVVVVNALVGFFQEYRAEKAMLALRALTSPRARVVRDGQAVVIEAKGLVPGDLLLLEAGDVVAADARVLVAHRLTTNEAPLTGESVPVEKSTAPTSDAAPLAERTDCVFMGTAVSDGQGEALVLATGMHTELGKIAELLATAEQTQTPLQARLARLSRLLLYGCLGVVGVVAALGLLRGHGALEVFLASVSLAVAAVPEGLPAIVTIALAIGVQRMAARHVLVRRLPAVETLGCTTVICTDKTGTLTTGVMTVREVWGDEGRVLGAATAASDAELSADGKTGVGDSTEVAILLAAAARGIHRAALEAQHPRVQVNPFDAARKRMSIRRADGVLYVKGALELMLPLCTGGTHGAAEANAALASQGLRVLAVATGTGEREEGLELLGLVGIADAPRPEVHQAIAQARAAGIETVMITGDHPLTAAAIARELGIDQARVHARATPKDKLDLVRALKAKGEIVTMTGDGVNDAPALREAHVGVCMGKTGTDVTREASDVVLTDDHFGSIVAAVREGRAIFANLRRALVYLLSGNIGELLLMFAASVAGLPAPLLPLHLLWVNLVTDGLPALALVTEKPGRSVMRIGPRDPKEPLLRGREWWVIGLTGLIEAGVVLAVFAWALQTRDEREARTLAFTTLVLAELLRAFAARSVNRVFWELGPFTNLALLATVVGTLLVQGLLLQWPAARGLFGLGVVPLADFAACALALLPVTALEVSKLVRRALSRRRGRQFRPSV